MDIYDIGIYGSLCCNQKCNNVTIVTFWAVCYILGRQRRPECNFLLHFGSVQNVTKIFFTKWGILAVYNPFCNK